MDASLYDVKTTGWVEDPSASNALPWFCTNSEAFSNLRVEPGVKTRVVSNGTDALPLLMTGFEPPGAWRTKDFWVNWPVIGLRDGVPGRATTTTGPLKASCEAA